MKQEKEGT